MVVVGVARPLALTAVGPVLSDAMFTAKPLVNRGVKGTGAVTVGLNIVHKLFISGVIGLTGFGVYFCVDGYQEIRAKRKAQVIEYLKEHPEEAAGQTYVTQGQLAEGPDASKNAADGKSR
jgi:hypothetical protein